MEWTNWFLIVFLSWTLSIQSTVELQPYQNHLLLQLRKHLEYPSVLDAWESYNGDLCNLSSTSHLSIICQDDSVAELKIMGNKLVKVGEFRGLAVPNQTLSQDFSIDSFITTLTRLASLRVLSLVSLGIWGTLPDKIHRLYSLELLDLSSNFLFGSVPPQLSRLVKLNSLTLDGNYFNGTVPDWLDSFSNLTALNLKSNRFIGQFPSSISRINTLTDITLCHNRLTGKLPDLSTLTSLHVLDLRDNKLDSDLPAIPNGLIMVLLSNNSFSGKIPAQFGQLSQIEHLDLSLNNLSGIPPPSLFSLLNIRYLNLESNKLRGSFPTHLTCGSKLGFVDISANMFIGRLPSCLDRMGDKITVKFGGNCMSIDDQNQHPQSYCEKADMEVRRSRGRTVGELVAFIGGAVIFIGILAFGVLLLCRRYCLRRTFEQNIISKAVSDNTPTAVSSEVLANARFISQVAKLGAQGGPVCGVFSLEELKEATKDFDSSTLMGEGFYGKVYRGRLENGTYIAVRSLPLLKRDSIQNLKVRLDMLSKLHHPHLVGLLGHCISSGRQDYSGSSKIFVVYEYVPDGNYSARLTDTYPDQVLKWPDRLAILIGVAKAVHFLHTGVIPGTFNNRLKTNNILLDEHQIPKLSDYGMSVITEEIDKLEAKGEGPNSSRKTNLEDDVYNFGFILLESLVGPVVSGKEEAFLLNEMVSFGSQDGRRQMVDPIVLTTSSQESLSIVVSLTTKCISPEPISRPSFEDVLWNLQYAAQVQATADADQKSDSTSYP